MSVQKFIGTIETDGVKDERGIETPSLSATGEVSGKTGVFTDGVTAPVFNGKATSAGSADSATNATNDGAGNNIADTYATKEALAEETSAREAADETLSRGITAEATARAQEISALQTGLTGGTITVAQATHAASANTANALSQSGRVTQLWTGTLTAGNEVNVPNVRNYTQLLVKERTGSSNIRENYYVYTIGDFLTVHGTFVRTDISPLTLGSNADTIVISMNALSYAINDESDNGLSFTSIVQNITQRSADGESAKLEPMERNTLTVTIIEIWGVETTKNPS